MAGIRFSKLLDDFVGALERSGATVHVRRGRTRPAEVRVVTSDGVTDCYVYLWTITHGGASRSSSEYRIQITGVAELRFDPGWKTVLGGWSPENGVYAFWDPTMHTHFSLNSPSVQVPLDMLTSAASAGIQTQQRRVEAGDEVIVTTRPDGVGWYIRHAAGFVHAMGRDVSAANSLVQGPWSAATTFLSGARSEAAKRRRKALVAMMRTYRDGKFQGDVLKAYGHRCAVCGSALRLVDAAHVVPVSHPDSTDDIDNGLALCRIHHGAYDTSLLGILQDYRVAINEVEVLRLRKDGKDYGLDSFRQALPPAIMLPGSPIDRPSPANLVRGLDVRQWPDDWASPRAR
jgi:putative restriction endonuclease